MQNRQMIFLSRFSADLSRRSKLEDVALQIVHEDLIVEANDGIEVIL